MRRRHFSFTPMNPFSLLRLFQRPWQWLLLLLVGSPFAWAAGVSINNVVISSVKQLSFAQAKAEVDVTQRFTQAATARLSPGSVTYRSKDPAVATVNAQTGEVTGVLAGETTIFADQAASPPYPPASASYTIKVKGQPVSFDPWQLASVMYGVPAYQITPPTSPIQGGSITYSLKDPGTTVVSVTKEGVVTVKAVGKTTIVATRGAFGVYDASSVEAVFEVTGVTPSFTWPNQAVSLGSTLNLAPPTDSPSGGTYSYKVLNEAIATVNGNVLTPLQVGTTHIEVSQNAHGNFVAGSLHVPLSVVAGNTSVVSLVLPPNPIYGAVFTPQTSTNSDGSVTLVSMTPGIAQIDSTGTQVQVIGLGTATIKATVSETAHFPAAETVATFTSIKADPHLDMSNLTRLVSSAAFELPISTLSEGAITATTSTPAVATVEPMAPTDRIPRVIPRETVGTTTLTIQQAATDLYNAATISRTLELTGKTPRITWAVPSYINSGSHGTTIELPAAISDSPGTKRYSVSYGQEAEWATLNGLTLWVNGGRASTLTLTVEQDPALGFGPGRFDILVGVDSRNPYSGLYRTELAVDTHMPHRLGDGPFRLATSSNNTSAVQLQHLTGPIEIVGGPIEDGQPTMLIKPLQPGMAKVRVFQDANATHAAASVDVDVLIISDVGAIQEFKPAPLHLDDTRTLVPAPEPVSLSAGAYSYEVGDTGIAEVVGAQLRLKKAGTTWIRVKQEPNAIYAEDTAAADLVVLHQPSDLAFPQAQMATMYTSSPKHFPLNATTSSPKAIVYSSTNPAVAFVGPGGDVTLTGVAGSTTFIAMQDVSDDNWYGAGQAAATLTVQELADSGLRLQAFSVPLSATHVTPPYQTDATDRPVILDVGDTSYASVDPADPKRLVLHKTGEVRVTVRHPATATLPEATASAFMTITLTAPTISDLPANIHHVWQGASPPPTVLVPMPAGNYQVTSSDAGVATVNGMEVTLVGIGDAHLVVRRIEDADWAESSVTIPVRVEAQAPTGARLPMLALSDQSLPSTALKYQLQAKSDNPEPITYSIVSMSQEGMASLSEQGELLISGVGTVTVKASQAETLPTYLAHGVTATITVHPGKPLFEVTYLPAEVKPGDFFEYRYRTNDPRGSFMPYVYSHQLAAVSHAPPTAAGEEGVMKFKVNPDLVTQDVWIGVIYITSHYFNNDVIEATDDMWPKYPPPARSLRVNAAGTAGYTGHRLEGPLEWTLGSDPSNNPWNIGMVPHIINSANQVVGTCVTYLSSDPAIVGIMYVGIDNNIPRLEYKTAGHAILSCQEDPSLSTTVNVRGQEPQFGTFPPYELSVDSAPVAVVPPHSNNLTGTWTFSVVSNSGASGGPAIALVNGQLEPVSEGQAVIRATQAATGQFHSKFMDTLVTVKASAIKSFESVTATYGDKDFTMPRPVTPDQTTPFKYSIDDQTVATVDADTGLVKIVGAGSATVTAQQGSQSVTATLTVRKAVPRLSFFMPEGIYLKFSGCTDIPLRWPRANFLNYSSGDPHAETVPGANLSTNSDGQLFYQSDSPLLGWALGDAYPQGIKRAAELNFQHAVFYGRGTEHAVPFKVWVQQAESRNFHAASAPAIGFFAYTTEGSNAAGDPTRPLVFACDPDW